MGLISPDRDEYFFVGMKDEDLDYFYSYLIINIKCFSFKPGYKSIRFLVCTRSEVASQQNIFSLLKSLERTCYGQNTLGSRLTLLLIKIISEI